MLGTTYESQNCSAARALELVGERWSLLILRDALFRGMTRFSEFERSLGVAPNVLAKRLEAFVGSGLLTKDADSSAAEHYRLTAKGLSFKPVIVALTAWGDQWAAPQGPPVRFEHEGCGGAVAGRLCCARCGDGVALRRLVAIPDRGAGRSRSPRQVTVASKIGAAAGEMPEAGGR
jgi:DNA-binding HxlR family transcriptional regulator